MKWVDLTKEAGLNDKAYKELPVGKMLHFSYEGSEVWYKIMRKRNGKIWGKQVNLYHPDEIRIVKKR